MDLQKNMGSYEKLARDQYVGKFSSYIIHGIGETTLDKLHLEGVLSVEKLAVCDAKEISLNTGVPERVINFLKLKAISTLENEIYKINHFEFPVKNIIYLDIETMHRGNNIWLIGCLKDSEFAQFYADNRDEEKQIFEEFREYIKDSQEDTLVSYSETEYKLKCINKGFKRHKINHQLEFKHLDLCKPISNCFIFPHQYYGIKQIGTALGYEFTYPDITGPSASSFYEEHIENQTSVDPRALKYNEDDVKAAKHINEALQNY
jgi:predicted RecB family nuclease